MKMNQKNIVITGLVVAFVAGISILVSGLLDSIETDLSTNYTPSDMSKALPQFDDVLEGGDVTMATTKIEDVKDQIQYTIRGTVVRIGTPEEWTDPTPQPEELQKIMGKNVKIPVDIEVARVGKAKSAIQSGEIVTVNVLGRIVDNTLYLNPNSPQFESGEDIIVHISVDPSDIIEKNFKFVQLGEYGKYKIQDGKAFNPKHPHGRDIVKALDETK
jgi:hypothetical protein